MNTTAGGLKELHRLHLRFKQVQDKLDRGPKQIKARQQITARKEAERAAQKERLTTLKKTADQRSLQMKTNENKIADLKVKLNTASSNREFDIIKSQIDADTMANSVLEDEILEILEKVDQAQIALAELDRQCAEALADEKRFAEQIAAKEPELQGEAQELQAAIKEAESTLPSSIMVDYRRLVQAHGASALAAVENGVCTECNVGLSPQLRVELNTGQIVFCRSCGRLLYPADND